MPRSRRPVPKPGEAWRVWMRAADCAADCGTDRTVIVRVLWVGGDRMTVLVCGALAEIPTALGVRRVKWAEMPEKGAGAG